STGVAASRPRTPQMSTAWVTARRRCRLFTDDGWPAAVGPAPGFLDGGTVRWGLGAVDVDGETLVSAAFRNTFCVIGADGWRGREVIWVRGGSGHVVVVGSPQSGVNF